MQMRGAVVIDDVLAVGNLRSACLKFCQRLRSDDSIVADLIVRVAWRAPLPIDGSIEIVSPSYVSLHSPHLIPFTTRSPQPVLNGDIDDTIGKISAEGGRQTRGSPCRPVCGSSMMARRRFHGSDLTDLANQRVTTVDLLVLKWQDPADIYEGDVGWLRR